MPLSTFFRRKSLKHAGPRRTVWVNQRSLDDTWSAEAFSSNRVTTSKYTVWNFLCKNLFEQFRRIANFYFLCIAITQLSIKSPVSPFTSLLPLIFVVSVTALKQAYEDWLRHKADNGMNSRPTAILRDGQLDVFKSEEIQIGDIVLVGNDQESPCDLVILSSSNSNGHCHITTANLDGETNLKDHLCPEETKELSSLEQLDKLIAVIECDHPSPELYKFLGKITIFDEHWNEKNVCSLNEKNLLLKGASVKNTDFVYGCAIYTGPDTKLVLNLKLTSNKFSTVEKTLNTFLMIFLLILLIQACIGTVLKFTYNYQPAITMAWYLPSVAKSDAREIIPNFLSFVILFNYIIPISLYVTLDLVKFIGALFFTWDIDLYDETRDEPAVCNSSDLNEELGQVEYLFSDKTGTLTENQMVFRLCSVDGVKLKEKNRQLLYVCDDELDQEVIEHFLIALVLCNTVQIHENSNNDEEDNNRTELEYFASSPDEKALVEACAWFGIVLTNVVDNLCTVKTLTGMKVYKKLCILEFNPDRKRMSIVIEDEDGSLHLYCKGADSAVLNNCVSGEVQSTKEHVYEYSVGGFRTLVIAEKILTLSEYQKFSLDLYKASCLLQDRDENISLVYHQMEKDLHLLGATAVEDKLQDHVADTIESLRAAGIKVWVLTGDHPETALNISFACGHISRDMTKLCLFEQHSSEDCFFSLKQMFCSIESNPRAYYLIVDGASIAYALLDNPELFRSVAVLCVAVLCCRMSPLQKSEVVRLVKTYHTAPITAAIGDGANDVSMIQEAHVGLGIIGHEGRHAVRCADFAFSRFYYLKKVLLVHGRYYYVRASMLVQYFFYKNVAFVVPQFIFIFFNGFTPQAYYNSVFLMMYNICFTSLPIFIYGFTEKQKSEEELMNNPELYKQMSRNSFLTYWQFAIWMMIGMWHGLVTFFGVYFFWKDSPVGSDGKTLDLWCMGVVAVPIVIVIANAKLAFHSKYWTFMYFCCYVVSIIGFPLFTLLYTSVVWSVKTSSLYGVYFMVIKSFSTWLLTILLLVIAMLPDIFFLMLNQYNVTSWKTFKRGLNFSFSPREWLEGSCFKPNNGIAISQINIFRNSASTETVM